MDNQNNNQTKTGPVKKKRGLYIAGAILLVIVLLLGAVYIYFENAINEGDAGKLDPAISGSDTRDVIYILVCGIDYDADDENRDGIGLTDLIMLVCYDRKDNTATVLQIPRDSYVGEDVPTGGTGKINALYSHGDNKVDRISNLAKVINDQFQLPVDYYLTINMNAFREIIDVLGGIEMYVPWDVPVFDESGNQVSLIEAGTHRIDGATAEIIVRSRKAYAQGDLKRLEMQQYFYAAIFKTYRTFPLSDIIKVIPNFIPLINTDMSIPDLVELATGLQKLDSSRIGVLRCPGGGLGEVNGHRGLYGINAENLALLLNQYMRPYSDAVPVDKLSLPKDLEYPSGEINDDIKIMGDLPSE